MPQVHWFTSDEHKAQSIGGSLDTPGPISTSDTCANSNNSSIEYKQLLTGIVIDKFNSRITVDS